MYTYTAEELDILRTGGRVLAGIMRDLQPSVVPGATVHDIEMRARELIKDAGAESGTIGYKPQGAAYPFPAAACVSVNDEVAHGISYENMRTLEEGDVVSVDIIIKYQGMFLDICRTWGAGELSEQDKELVAAARKSTDAAIAEARVGNTVDDIGRAAQETAARYGCQTVRELGGHGVGKKIHMGPFVPNFAGSGFRDKLKPGMILAIEPILARGGWEIDLGDDQWVFRTRDGSRSAQFEETVLVTDGGPEILTRTD